MDMSPCSVQEALTVRNFWIKWADSMSINCQRNYKLWISNISSRYWHGIW